MSQNFTSILLKKTIQDLKQLQDQLQKYDKAYFNDAKPLIDDATYDRLKNDYQNLIQTIPKDEQHVFQDTIGFTPTSGEKYSYTIPMLSLNKSYTQEEVEKFIKKIYKYFEESYEDSHPPLNFLLEPKIDGISLNLLYKQGKLQLASTRGDGKTGEIVTQVIMKNHSIPKTIPYLGLLELRGEIFIPIKSFITLNNMRQKQGLSLFQTPRNTAAGFLKQRKINNQDANLLQFMVYTLGETHQSFQSYTSFRNTVKQFGFALSYPTLLTGNYTKIESYFERMSHIRAKLPFDCDGIVIKLNNLEKSYTMGFTSTTPRAQIARKFSSLCAWTNLQDIQFHVGRTGTLTPVATVSPVNIGGVIVRRASLHNKHILQNLNIHKFDQLLIERAGDVIPHIIERQETKQSLPIQLPSNCPSCHQPLLLKDKVLICPNHDTCPAQQMEHLNFIVSRPILNIDHLGPSSIKEFWDLGWIKKPKDIYELYTKKNDIIKLHGWNNLSVENLLNAIHKSKTLPLSAWISTLGLPFIGKETAVKLAPLFQSPFEVLNSLEKIFHHNEEEIQRWKTVDMLKDKKIEHIQDRLTHQFFKINYDFAQYFTTTISQAQKHTPLSSYTVVFSGTLSIPRNEAKSLIEQLGGHVGSIVSHHTSYLIIGNNPKSKLQKAKSLGIPIMNEEEFHQWIKKNTL